MLSETDRQKAADILIEAQKTRKQATQLTVTFPGITFEDAYAISTICAKRRGAAGEKLIGHKVGLTSKAMQQSSQIDEPDYGYLFERAIPWPEHPEYQAFHSGELPYVFDNLSLLARPWTAEDHALARVTSSYWVNFIRSGDPNGPGLPPWPSNSEQVMRLGLEPRAALGLDAERARLFASVTAGK